MYADDTVMFLSRKAREQLEKHLKTDFGRIVDWMKSINLITNMKKGKTECMLFGTNQ